MKALGIEGEDLAVKFLRKIGYKIVAKNYKTQISEIDIIARDGDTTVFIEVKMRTNDSFRYPFVAVLVPFDFCFTCRDVLPPENNMSIKYTRF